MVEYIWNHNGPYQSLNLDFLILSPNNTLITRLPQFKSRITVSSGFWCQVVKLSHPWYSHCACNAMMTWQLSEHSLPLALLSDWMKQIESFTSARKICLKYTLCSCDSLLPTPVHIKYSTFWITCTRLVLAWCELQDSNSVFFCFFSQPTWINRTLIQGCQLCWTFPCQYTVWTPKHYRHSKQKRTKQAILHTWYDRHGK